MPSAPQPKAPLNRKTSDIAVEIPQKPARRRRANFNSDDDDADCPVKGPWPTKTTRVDLYKYLESESWGAGGLDSEEDDTASNNESETDNEGDCDDQWRNDIFTEHHGSFGDRDAANDNVTMGKMTVSVPYSDSKAVKSRANAKAAHQGKNPATPKPGTMTEKRGLGLGLGQVVA